MRNAILSLLELVAISALTSAVAKSAIKHTGEDSDFLDCGVRHASYEYALRAQPWLTAPCRRLVWDALQLNTICGKQMSDANWQATTPPKHVASEAADALHVATKGSDEHGDGSERMPFRTAHHALSVLRKRSTKQNRTIVLHSGIHFLGANGTLELTRSDSGTLIMGAPAEEVWISGGIPLDREAMWEKVTHPSVGNVTVWKTKVRGVAPGFSIRSLFTVDTHERLTWARYPNMDIETEQWGYGSPNRHNVSINANMVLEWTKPVAGTSPQFTAIDLTDSNNPTGFVKNNSAMPGYNTFNIGSGGACDTVWEGPSYWCGNESAGGWAEVDFQCARSGQLQIPTGLHWNTTLGRLSNWGDPRGAFVHAWHSQTWAMHMYEIESFDAQRRTMEFAPGGGSQGGRNWCRCDQCGYAAGLWSDNGNFCGRVQDSHGHDTRLIGGNWIVEGVFEELDRPGEFWYNTSSQELWVWPNISDNITDSPPQLAIPLLTSIVSVEGASDIVIAGLGFRDAVSTYDKRWSAPSGGDWALHRSGAIHISDAENIEVRNCSFRRLDGNALMLSGRVRGAHVSKCTFEWIGQNAAAGWGDTDPEHMWDGRSGNQPRGTIVEDSLFHDVGLFQKQSSAWFQAKTAQTQLRNNIMYNLPRAAINFNDGFGGGSLVEGNLIFNTCRESGDHGPINSWDGQPFLTDVAGGPGDHSFDPSPNEISGNFIWANYGAAQGVDNDDGSSFYRISGNVFYDADGFKMDYGGHGSIFQDNLVVTKTSRGECIGVASFLQDLGDTYVNNTCWLLVLPATGATEMVGSVSQCNTSFMDMHGNTYATSRGNATLSCGGSEVRVVDLHRTRGIDSGSTATPLPSKEHMLLEIRRRLGLLSYEGPTVDVYV